MMKQLFGNLEKQRILGIFAHPDDEVFCAGGTLARAVALGVERWSFRPRGVRPVKSNDTHIATRRSLG